ncbi:hypothetical protein F5I97DRAFT_264208 [Phlebopus sp. FC_14]|nr:hypothetical protein F5I97DRAFT_264208 [Phlebopus sp. FC_14]
MTDQDIELVNCWLRGADTSCTFSVINPSRTRAKEPDVSTLKKAIKQTEGEIFKGIIANSLTLYQVSPALPYDDSISDRLANLVLSNQRLLKGSEKLSTLFPADQLNDSFLHIVVDAFKLRLLCWIQGEPISRTSPVTIDASKGVPELKRAIKDAVSVTFKGTDAKDITLYKVCLPIDGTLEGKLTNLQYDDPLDDTRRLSEIFKDVRLRAHLHIVIQSPDSEGPCHELLPSEPKSTRGTIGSSWEEPSEGSSEESSEEELEDELGVIGWKEIQRVMDGYVIQRLWDVCTLSFSFFFLPV